MADFTPQQIEDLAAMLDTGEDQGPSHVYGSALNPSTLHGAKEDKEVAKPGVKMNVRLNNRNPLKGGAIISEEDAKIAQKQAKEEGKDIWTDQEVNIAAEERPDDRPEPKYEIKFKQTVGTEDVFLGLSDRDPSSTHCEALLVIVELPKTKFANV